MSDNDIQNPHANIPPPPPKQTASKNTESLSQRLAGKISTGVQNWKENADFRMKICNTCPHYNAPRCQLCGCFMVAKTKIPQARCPAGKW